MRLLVGVVTLLALAGPANAQRNEATLEASVFRGAASYARQVSARTLLGIEAGFGFPQIDRTLEPQQDDATGEPDLEEYLHVAAFLRLKPSQRFELDAGVRASVVDLWPCGSSDCWPVLFGGVYLQPMVGWRRIKLGVRLIGGRVAEGESGAGSSTTAVGLTPFLVRATFPW